jgi:hypothetical protein
LRIEDRTIKYSKTRIAIGCKNAYAGLDLVFIAARTRERKINEAGAPIPRYGDTPVK